MRALRWLFVAATAAGVGGCGLLEERLADRAPSASVDALSLSGLSFDGAELLADVRIDNPNPIGIRMAGLDYQVLVEGSALASGSREEGVRIGALQEGQFDLPVQIRFDALQEMVQSLRGREEVAYTLALDMVFDLPGLGERTVPVEAEGTLPVPRRPEIGVAGIRLKELGWTQARAILELDVTNPNAFELAIDRLSYSLSVDDQPWASADEGVSLRVPAEDQGRLALPLNLELAAIGGSAFRLLREGGGLDYKLDGAIEGSAGDERLGRFDLDYRHAGEAEILGVP
ncbi:MAG: LEA type 2 family protein [Halorhodospira sp.]